VAKTKLSQDAKLYVSVDSSIKTDDYSILRPYGRRYSIVVLCEQWYRAGVTDHSHSHTPGSQDHS